MYLTFLWKKLWERTAILKKVGYNAISCFIVGFMSVNDKAIELWGYDITR